MYNSLARLQNAFGLFTSVAFAVATLVALTDLLAPRAPVVSLLKPAGLQVVRGRPHYYSTKKEEYAVVRFSLEADLSSLFTWNTKQVFVYVTAEWPEPGRNGSSSSSSGSEETKEKNRAVIWDSIITSPSADHLANIGPATLKKLRKSAAGKPVDPSRGILHLKNQKPKYQITSPTGRIAETDGVVLRAHYNVQPWVGLLTWDQARGAGRWAALAGGESEVFALPAVKAKKAAGA